MRTRFLLRALFLAVVLTLLSLLLIPIILGFGFIWGITHMPCSGGQGTPSSSPETVTFNASSIEREVHGEFLPGTNGVTLIIPPTGGSDAGYWRREYTVLNDDGYALFNYESRRCLDLPISLGYSEVDEVGDALAYLASREDVDATRIGIYGFSTSGATSIMAGARYPQLAAVIASGGYHDFPAYNKDQSADAWFAPLYLFGMHRGYRMVTGLEMDVLSPISVIDQIAPRPLLLIYGTQEPSRYGARLQLAAAGEHAELWEVPAASHGGYYASAPEAYEQRVITFLDHAFGVER
ncbi:MAG: prolyl oligopeptidase family serine peptidase [Anaerolineae bacterium]|nr:prolyl oligopeptidase family serine peptidase [Anaerolineae bacterium]